MNDLVVVALSELLEKPGDMDPNTERFSLIEYNVYGAFSVYQQIYDDKEMNQGNHSAYVSRKRKLMS